MARILGHEDVRRLLQMSDCIEVIDRAQRQFSSGEVVMPVRLTTPVPDRGNHLSMPAVLTKLPALGLKCITIFPTNPSRKAPTLQGVVIYNDADTGTVLAVMSAAYLTAIRTAAASAVATRVLARPSASTLALIGAGVQAAGHLWAMTEVRPIERVRVAAGSQSSAERFIGEVSGRYPGIEFAAVRTLEEAIRDADIVCTVSSAAEPVTRPEWLKPGVHLNGVGSHSPNVREVDGETMRIARVVVDSREATLKECGDCMIPISEGLFDAEHVSDEVGEVLLGMKPGRSSDVEITVYQSCGLAVQDVATAKLVYEKALEQDAGVEVPL